MIVHCSLWKFKDGTTQAAIDDIVREWRALLGRVPSIRGIEIGPDVGNSPENYDLAALVFFDSAKGYEAYRYDLVHLEMGYKYIHPHIEGFHMRAAVQFELSADFADAQFPVRMNDPKAKEPEKLDDETISVETKRAANAFALKISQPPPFPEEA